MALQVGSTRGFPGVFFTYPHPYPQKPAPTPRGAGFQGCGLWVFPWVFDVPRVHYLQVLAQGKTYIFILVLKAYCVLLQRVGQPEGPFNERQHNWEWEM